MSKDREAGKRQSCGGDGLWRALGGGLGRNHLALGVAGSRAGVSSGLAAGEGRSHRDISKRDSVYHLLSTPCRPGPVPANTT